MAIMRALLIDLDGVIYQDEALVPGAPDALAWVALTLDPQFAAADESLANSLRQVAGPALVAGVAAASAPPASHP